MKYDPVGIASHPASFCNDYPEFTFLPLRISGPTFLSFFISFLATMSSRWYATHVIPKKVPQILFKVIPTAIVISYVVSYYANLNSKVYTFGGYDYSSNCSEFLNYEWFSKPDLLAAGNLMCNEAELSEYSKSKKTILITKLHNKTIVFGSDGKHHTSNNTIYFEDILGRMLIVSGKNILRESSFTSQGTDLLITLFVDQDAMRRGYPIRTGMVASQTTGTPLFHFTQGLSFFINPSGQRAFLETTTFAHTVKVARNVFSTTSVLRPIVNSMISSIGAACAVFCLLPVKVLRRFSGHIRSRRASKCD